MLRDANTDLYHSDYFRMWIDALRGELDTLKCQGKERMGKAQTVAMPDTLDADAGYYAHSSADTRGYSDPGWRLDANGRFTGQRRGDQRNHHDSDHSGVERVLGQKLPGW